MWKSVVGIIFNTNFGITSPKIGFKQNNLTQTYKGIPVDTFESSNVSRYFEKKELEKNIAQNHEIRNILNKYKIKYNLNMEELTFLKENHCKQTSEIAGDTAKYLPQALKERVNIKDLKEAAVLHDIGKALIPSEILNKAGELTPEETTIMNLHSELGYQILKNTGLNENILNIVRNHHKNTEGPRKFIPDINLQVLNLADKYSALLEKRPYKNELTSKQALTILYSEVQQGKIHSMVFKALVQAVSAQASKNKLNIS